LRHSGNLLLLLAFKSCRILKKKIKPTQFGWMFSSHLENTDNWLGGNKAFCSRASFLQPFPKEFLKRCFYHYLMSFAFKFLFLQFKTTAHMFKLEPA